MQKKGFAILVCAALAAASVATSTPAQADADVRVQAAGMLAAMQGNAARVATMLRQVRAARPVRAEQVKCVDDALSRVDAAVRAAKDDVSRVRAARASGDAPAAHRAMTRLHSEREAARDATLAADVCRGGMAASGAMNETTVHVVVDPKLPADAVVFKH